MKNLSLGTTWTGYQELPTGQNSQRPPHSESFTRVTKMTLCHSWQPTCQNPPLQEALTKRVVVCTLSV